MFSIDVGIDAGLLRQKGYQKSMEKNLWPYEKSKNNKGPLKA